MRGNALFLILIAVALFAALSYAITQSSRGGGNIDKEQAKLDAATAQLCTARVDQAVMRLKITGGCSDGQISYEYNGNNVNADAPEDKHCHVFDPAGAGETACGTYLTGGDLPADCETAAAGETCGGGSIVYVSDALGSRLYTTIADQGQYNWDGAQTACASLGDGWHLPTKDELNQLCLTIHTGSLNGTFNETGAWPDGIYWSSTVDGSYPWYQSFWDCFQNDDGYPNQNNLSIPVRCVRQ